MSVMRSVHLSRVESDPFAAGETVELLDVGLPDLTGAQLMATLDEAIAQEPINNVIARLRAIAAAAPAPVKLPDPEPLLELEPLFAPDELPGEPDAEIPLELTPEMQVNPSQAPSEQGTGAERPTTADVDGAKIFDEDFFEFI